MIGSTEQLSRWAIGFVWIYHGLATKLITVAPVEYYLSSQFGFSETGTLWFIKACGVYELAFGVAFICFYRLKLVVLFNIASMILLLIMVAFLDTRYLIEGFNPVATNIPVIALSLIMLNESRSRPSR